MSAYSSVGNWLTEAEKRSIHFPLFPGYFRSKSYFSSYYCLESLYHKTQSALALLPMTSYLGNHLFSLKPCGTLPRFYPYYSLAHLHLQSQILFLWVARRPSTARSKLYSEPYYNLKLSEQALLDHAVIVNCCIFFSCILKGMWNMVRTFSSIGCEQGFKNEYSIFRERWKLLIDMFCHRYTR